MITWYVPIIQEEEEEKKVLTEEPHLSFSETINDGSTKLILLKS